MCACVLSDCSADAEWILSCLNIMPAAFSFPPTWSVRERGVCEREPWFLCFTTDSQMKISTWWRISIMFYCVFWVYLNVCMGVLALAFVYKTLPPVYTLAVFVNKSFILSVSMCVSVSELIWFNRWWHIYSS